MDYKSRIDPELRRIAKKIPYNRAVIRCAGLFLPLSLFLTGVPRGVAHGRITLEGHRGLDFKTERFEPEGERGELPGLLYIHGGAFSYKASAYHKKLACLYAAKARCRVFFPDYHLLPDYPYPAAYDDVLALYRYVVENAAALGIGPERIGVAGDSAGAALAALLCCRCGQEGLPQPRIQMLVYPVTDVTMQTDSMERFPDTPLWNAENNRRMWAYYCRGLSTEETFCASPLHSGLPRVIPDTYIETAEYDCLHDEGILYAEKLRKAGASVELNETRGTIHGYDCALNTKIAARNVERRVLFLQRGLGPRTC